MINKRSVDYHPSSSGLCQEYILSFSGLLRALFFSGTIVKFSLEVESSLDISPWLGKIFKFIVVRLLENALASQKIESINF